MRKNTLNLIVDLCSFAVMLALACTGLIMAFVLPPGTGGAGGLSLWGMGRHDWGDVHFVLALVLIGLILVHVLLHWSWVYCSIRRLLSTGHAESTKAPLPATIRRAGLITLAGVALLIGGFLAGAQWSTQRTPAGGPGARRGCGGGGQQRALAPWEDGGRPGCRHRNH